MEAPKILQVCRSYLHTSAAAFGKRNIRKFPLHNKTGTREFRERQMTEQRQVPIDTLGVRPVGEWVNGRLRLVPEMVPELVVPDLTDCQLKPYVSYRAPNINQAEFTSRDLFVAIYSDKIIEDFTNGKLNEDGSSKEPSDEEKLTPDEAWARSRSYGSDMFEEKHDEVPDRTGVVPELVDPMEDQPRFRYHAPTKIL